MASKTLVIKIDGDPTGFKAATEIAAREARKTADIQERLTKKHLTDEQVALATRNRLVQKGNEERIKAATTAATAESGWAKAVGSVGAAMGPVIGQMLTIGALTSVVGAIAQMWSDMRESTSEAAKNIGDVRDRLNELAALKGRLGDTTTELADQLRFRSKTLQTEDSAIAYQKAAINYGSANIKSGMINEDEFRKAMEIGGKFQAAEGGAAGTHGELTGIMPALLKKKNATAEDIGGGVEKLFNIMQLGGFDF